MRVPCEAINVSVIFSYICVGAKCISRKDPGVNRGCEHGLQGYQYQPHGSKPYLCCSHAGVTRRPKRGYEMVIRCV